MSVFPPSIFYAFMHLKNTLLAHFFHFGYYNTLIFTSDFLS